MPQLQSDVKAGIALTGVSNPPEGAYTVGFIEE